MSGTDQNLPKDTFNGVFRSTPRHSGKYRWE